MTLTISLSINATLTNGNQYRTAILNLAWLTLPLTGWQRLTNRIETAVKLFQISFNMMTFALT
jgi:hypothetical protein